MADPSSDVHLILFFTRGISLQTWDEVGMFEREVALYRRLQQRDIQVSFVTYGDSTDLQLAGRIPGIRILCNHWRLPARLYSRLLPFLHGASLASASVYKSNQTSGAEMALQAAHLWRKPLIVRSGYLHSEFVARERAARAAQAARRLERKVYTAAQAVVVTTPEMKRVVQERYGVKNSHVWVIPNFVLADQFRPQSEPRRSTTLCFVGRLHPQKNLPALLEAVAGLPLRVLLIGKGALRADLETLAKSLGVNVQFLERVPHNELPALLNKTEIFVLPSHYEGHPKALIEAMSCGISVIGANSPGIRELIRHGETGWLCGTDPASIRSAIQELLAQPRLRAQLGRNARQFIVDNFSLDQIIKMELKLLHEVIK